MANWNCFLCKEFQSGTACTFCDDGSEFVRMTNADRIRSMTDEELGKAMFNFILNAASNPDFIMSPQEYTDWLQSEAE